MKHTILFSLLLISTNLIAQDLKETADKHYSNQQWDEAVKSYKQYLKKNKGDSSAWFNLGKSQLYLREYKEAIVSFEKAEVTNFSLPFVTYNLAKSYALNGSKEKSISTLNRGVENGLSAFQQLSQDTAFASINESEEFKKAIEAARLNFYPCLKNDTYRHFDFWLGEWEVYVNGNKVGDNNITQANGGCAIHESYSTARGYSGQSINYYDPQNKKWHQTWVGSAGGVLDYVEIDKAEGMLQFQCNFMNAQGKISYSRLTFTANDDGTVRQFFESSSDGENWTAGFDGLYRKRE